MDLPEDEDVYEKEEEDGGISHKYLGEKEKYVK